MHSEGSGRWGKSTPPIGDAPPAQGRGWRAAFPGGEGPRRTSPAFEIAGRPIGADHPPYVICELSGNHNGSLERALAMIDAAADTGCDAIKLQTYTADTLTLASDGPGFRIEAGPWAGRTLHDLYAEAMTPYAWHAALFERAARRGVTIFSTPFGRDRRRAARAPSSAPAYKIASFEAVDLPLIARVAACGKPMIISTGLASLAEMGEALETAHSNGAAGVALLHCVSAYPAPIEEANVRTVPDLARRFGVVTEFVRPHAGHRCRHRGRSAGRSDHREALHPGPRRRRP